MNSTLFAIAGISATIIFGGLSIYFVLKKRLPGEITFFMETCISLFDSIVKNFPELAILYNNRPIDKGLVLLKGHLLNTGTKDISESMIEKKIALTLPETYKWLSPKIISSSIDVKATISAEGHNLIFSTGLFRCKEHIGFQALAEIPIPEDQSLEKIPKISTLLDDNLKFSHRIADTNDIKKREMPDIRLKKEFFRVVLTGTILFTFILVLFSALEYFDVYSPPNFQINYLITLDSGKIIEVETIPKADNTLLIKGVDSEYKELVKAAQFFNNSNLKPLIKPKFMRRFDRYFFFFIVLFSCFFSCYLYLQLKKAIKFKNDLSMIDKHIMNEVNCNNS